MGVGVARLSDRHVAVGLPECRHCCLHRPGDADVREALGARDLEPHDGLAVPVGEHRSFGGAVGDPRDLVEAHGLTVGQRHGEACEFVDGAHRSEHPRGLLQPVDLAAPARGVLLRRLQRRRNVRRRHAESGHQRRIERDQHLAIDAAHAGDLGDALDRQQRLGDVVVDEPRQVGVVHARRCHGVREQRRAGGSRLRHARLRHAVRQVGARLVDGVAHLVERSLRILVQREADRDAHRAVGDGRVDVVEQAERRQLVLDLARDLGLQLGRRGAVQRRGDRDRGHVHVGKVLDVEPAEPQQSERGQQDEQQHGRNRVANRPGGDVHERAPAVATVTVAPSLRKLPPLATTWPSSGSPWTISTRPSRRRPVSMGWRCARCFASIV